MFRISTMNGSAIKERNLGQLFIYGSLILLVISGLNISVVNCKNISQDFFLNQIFSKYGNGEESITVQRFKHLLDSLGFKKIHLKTTVITHTDFAISEKQIAENSTHSHAPHHIDRILDIALQNATFQDHLIKKQCLTSSDILSAYGFDGPSVTISKQQFTNLCPAIIYQLDAGPCKEKTNTEVVLPASADQSNMVWLYAAIAVLVISLSGLLVVAVIPVLRGAYYHSVLQFLVALAVGSLIGDALLHLMPHALSGHEHRECHVNDDVDHDHHDDYQHCMEENGHLDTMVWKGLVAVVGIFIFFMAERLLTVCSLRRKKKYEVPANTLMGNDHDLNKTDDGCKKKYSSYPYCYGEVTVDMLKGLNDTGCEDPDHHNCLEKSSQTEESKQQPEEMKMFTSLRPKGGEGDHFDDSDNHAGVVTTHRDHKHHGHSHSHTRVPSSLSSVACMVIMGDGLHNFSDGLAIGAAFASSITGGVSTAIAVFCHELPHELGDFAVLLKSGMTAKQALAYNGLSSLLCFFGMVLGVGLGNLADVSPWIFAGAAGMFVYIALVDMIPELNSTANADNLELFLQFMGMLLGVTIMLLIALHEHDLQTVFHFT